MNLLAEKRPRKVLVYGLPVDMRNGSAGLQALVRNGLKEDPVSGDAYIFLSKNRKLVKCLFWDRTGFVLLCKRLERGCFRLRSGAVKLEIDEHRLSLLLDGIPVGGTNLPL